MKKIFYLFVILNLFFVRNIHSQCNPTDQSFEIEEFDAYYDVLTENYLFPTYTTAVDINCVKYSASTVTFDWPSHYPICQVSRPMKLVGTGTGSVAKIASTNNSINFKMATIDCYFFKGHTDGRSEVFDIKGYDNGVEVASVTNFNITNYTLQGSGNNAIILNKAYYSGEGWYDSYSEYHFGRLTFGTAWSNIDEIRFYSVDPSADYDYLDFVITNLDFETAGDAPSLTTTTSTIINTTSATVGGNVTDEGSESVTARGVCWSITSNPTTSDSKTTDGSGSGSFSSSMTSLLSNTTYHYRAYATNSLGTSYGDDMTVFTASTGPCPEMTETFSTDNGSILNDDDGYYHFSRDYFDVVFSNGSGNQSEIRSSGNAYAYSTNFEGSSYLDSENQHKFIRSTKFVLKNLTVDVEHAPTSGLSIRAFGPSNFFVSIEVNLNINAVYGTNNNTITVSGESNVKTITFGTGWSGITELQFFYQTFDPVALKIDNIVFTECTTVLNSSPTITTNAATDITSDSATAGGDITSDGGASVTAKGVCWSTSENPTISDFITSDGTGTGSFTSSLSGLSSVTTYHYRAYATNSVGTSYGDDLTFTTLASLPTITTTIASSITTTTVSSGGFVWDDGGGNVTARGVCWSTSANPTIADSKTSDGTGIGSFSSSLTGLTAGTTYHYRAYTTNSVGTSYGDDLTFTTLASLPTITTTTASSVTSATASAGGNITSDGGASVTAKGVCWSTSANPTIADSKTSDGTGTGSFTSLLTGLSAGTTYHYRAYATNSVGTSYGSDLTLSSNCSQIETFNPTYPNDGDGYQTTVPPTMNYFSVFKQTDPYVRGYYGEVMEQTLGRNKNVFDNNIWYLSNEGEEYYDANNDEYITTLLTYSVTKFTQYSKFTLKTMNVGRTQNTADDQASLTFSGYLGSSLICSPVTVDLFQSGVYGTGENTITSTRIVNEFGEHSLLTFGSAWTGINMFKIEVLTDHPTYIGIDHIVHEVACSCTKPVSQNFNDAYGVTPGNPSYSHNNVLLGCVNYSIAYNSMAFWNTTQPNMSGTSLAVDQISSSTATYFKMASTDNSINFKLSEFQMSKITGNSSINYNIVGYNNGSSAVTVNGINLGSSATFGSGNDAITYTKNASTEGGKLSFGSNWEEIDEVRIFSAGGEKLHFELDDIVFLDKPTVSTTTATSVTTTTASSGGNVSDEGSTSVTSRGVCWSTSVNPTISDSKTTDASGTGSFTSSLSGLTSGTTYHYRAYATNSAGTSYGSDLTFTTISVGPSTFQSTTTGNWSTAGSWLSSAVPSSTDNAQINNGHNVTISANTTIDDLILKSGSTVTVSGTAVLTITGNLQDEGGNFAVASGAQVVVMGNVNNSSAASKLVNTSTNGLVIKGNVDVGQ